MSRLPFWPACPFGMTILFKSTPHTSAPPHDAAKAVKALTKAIQTATDLRADLTTAGLHEESHLLDAFLCSAEERLKALAAVGGQGSAHKGANRKP